MKKWIPFLICTVLVFSAQHLCAQGCSQCKMLSEQAAELDENSFGSSINTGILYLMIIPYLLIMFLFRKQIVSFFRSMLIKR